MSLEVRNNEERQDEVPQESGGPSVESILSDIKKWEAKVNGAPKAPEKLNERREAQERMAEDLNLKEKFEEDEDPEKRVEVASAGLFEIYSESKEREKLRARLNFDRKPGDGGEMRGIDADDMAQIKSTGNDYDSLRQYIV